jgi:hypothetical protein
MSESHGHPSDPSEAERPTSDDAPSDLDRPVQGDETEYIEKGLKEEDKERR